MRDVLRLNVLGFLYAVTALVPLELVLNVHRIERLTNWPPKTVSTLIGATTMIVIVAGTMLLWTFTRKWFRGLKRRFWTVILWIPYMMLFIYLFVTLFPITYQGDYPSPGTGLLLIGAFIMYPLYIIILNTMSLVADLE